MISEIKLEAGYWDYLFLDGQTKQPLTKKIALYYINEPQTVEIEWPPEIAKLSNAILKVIKLK